MNAADGDGLIECEAAVRRRGRSLGAAAALLRLLSHFPVQKGVHRPLRLHDHLHHRMFLLFVPFFNLLFPVVSRELKVIQKCSI